jgi:hypothetical protein
MDYSRHTAFFPQNCKISDSSAFCGHADCNAPFPFIVLFYYAEHVGELRTQKGKNEHYHQIR